MDARLRAKGSRNGMFIAIAMREQGYHVLVKQRGMNDSDEESDEW
jgi:hypothetical protein